MKWLVTVFSIMISSIVYAEALDQGRLSIYVSSAKNNQGNIEIHLLNTQQQFNSETAAFLHCTKKIKQKKAICEFPNLPFDYYVIYAFHDENTNGQLDTNIFTMPSEKLTISGIDLTVDPEPSYQQSQFLFNSQHGQIFINLQ